MTLRGWTRRGAEGNQRDRAGAAPVFGAAFAGSWAIANLFGLGATVARILDFAFLACGAVVMFYFVRFAQKIEPFSR